MTTWAKFLCRSIIVRSVRPASATFVEGLGTCWPAGSGRYCLYLSHHCISYISRVSRRIFIEVTIVSRVRKSCGLRTVILEALDGRGLKVDKLGGST